MIIECYRSVVLWHIQRRPLKFIYLFKSVRYISQQQFHVLTSCYFTYLSVGTHMTCASWLDIVVRITTHPVGDDLF